jgi:hypothetical protein
VDESDLFVVRAQARLVVNQLQAALLHFFQAFAHAVHIQADVMDAFAAPGDKLGDRRIVVERFEQFKSAFSDRQKSHSHALVLHHLEALRVEAERVSQLLIDFFAPS